MTAPLLIGHRGASGYLPEHTLEAYGLAIEQGADYIEPDLVVTRDGVLVARHENEIGGTTDIATRPRFRDRRARRVVDGVEIEGWFTEDFTLDELKSLRVRERLPELRPQNTAFDGRFTIPTLAEILAFLADVNRRRAAAGAPPVGLCPETKHPSHFRDRDLAIEPRLLRELEGVQHGAPVLIQSFETGNLRALREQCDHRLLQLVDSAGGPWDLQPGRSYADLLAPAGLVEVAAYAHALGVNKTLVLRRDATDRLERRPTPLVREAHAAGLQVIAWTFRAENPFLPADLRIGTDPRGRGDVGTEIRRHLEAGIDGFFVDQPDAGRGAVDGWRAATARAAPGKDARPG
jgi:glycerophosphoryl diester phosphodiesterase